MNVRVHTGKAWPINLTDNEFVEIFNKPGDSESDIFSDNKIDNIAMKDAIIIPVMKRKNLQNVYLGRYNNSGHKELFSVINGPINVPKI